MPPSSHDSACDLDSALQFALGIGAAGSEMQGMLNACVQLSTCTCPRTHPGSVESSFLQDKNITVWPQTFCHATTADKLCLSKPRRYILQAFTQWCSFCSGK
ncbi:hypothetical protein Y1Q_0013014 [Alligator mississippiensis]|uniref:Uncharacterized protein n=1 Tax=Alligator mississippiensis TaxID=8496 RepID=A0A151MTI4_ALLMI|nr:hypothetical protein Y1Q_0013014 [Alligator mississippiensis]